MSDKGRSRLDWLVLLLGLAAMANGIAWLTLWFVGIAGRWSAEGQIILKTNMALGMVLGGSSLLLLGGPPPTARQRLVGAALAALLLLIGGLTLSEHIFGWDLGIDQLLATEQPGAKATAAPNRMGPPASTSHTLLGLGLLLLATGRRRAVPYLGLAVLLVNVVPLIGFLYALSFSLHLHHVHFQIVA